MNKKSKFELKKLAELKATALNTGNDILFDESESRAIELCWIRRPEMESDLFSQEAYDEYYAYYQECVNHLENEGKIPATKIKNETMTIIRDGSKVVGCCSFETPYVVLQDTTGREYIWCSNTVEQKDMLGRVGEQVTVTAFARPCTGHLHRVKVTLLGQIN